MIIRLLAICTLLLASNTYKVSITNLEHTFEPHDELDYVNYLKAILGRADQSTSKSEQLIKIIKSSRLSIKNSADQIVLAFIPYSTSQNNSHSTPQNKQIQISGKLIQELVLETPQLFIITNLPQTEQKTLHHLIQVYKKQNKIVHVIRGKSQDLLQLREMLNLEQALNNRRLSKTNMPKIQQTSTDNNYLIKFFFSLMYIIVIVAVIGFIAQNDGKKDTLLYAKFLTDVNNMR